MDIGIRGIVGMPARTMRSSSTAPSINIDSARHRLKMFRVDTSPHTTEMIQIKAKGDVTARQFVSRTVGIETMRTNRNATISSTAIRSEPNETTRVRFWLGALF